VRSCVEGQSFPAIVATGSSQTYPDVHFDEVVRPEARAVTREIANLCAGTPEILDIVDATRRLPGGRVLAIDPGTGPFGERLRQNSVHDPIAAPMLILQGDTHSVVDSAETTTFVRQRCAAGQSLEYRTYAGQDHMGVGAPDSLLNEDLLRWTQGRLAGLPQPAGCQTVGR
jgi:hypothetical protein